ncbi:MAG: carbamoyl-phosphate synthase large subunit, partial [Actinomycetota bacterium]
RMAEDREEFRSLMREIGEPVPESWVVESETELREQSAQKGLPWPLIVRPAYTLGGTGGGIAHTVDELLEIGSLGLKLSMRHQVLVERYLTGWKEVEYEVMRDGANTCITICNMENLDPMGVHTGDSIVVAPSQTLSDKEYQMLRSASLKIIRALGIEGGCNVQLALDPNSFQYYVIEVNPRVSRSSALASKATGYPIARVSAKIAVGLRLDEIQNAVTRKTLACFEPALDYCVAKIPRWPFDKFVTADRTLGSQMKATGEVMAIGRTFESALLKAVRSLEVGIQGLRAKNAHTWSDMELEVALRQATDERLFAVAEAFRRGWEIREVQSLSYIDPWFLHKIRGLVRLEDRFEGQTPSDDPAFLANIQEAKRNGISDHTIADRCGVAEAEIREYRWKHGVKPVYKMVDTCAAEFEAATPYFYSTYETEDEASEGSGFGVQGSDPAAPSPTEPRTPNPEPSKKPKAIVIGSGPIRIGQGIEFDYCTVHGVWALREAGYESIVINNNPETVSTDFDTSDRLYFEPLTLENVLAIVAEEKPEGVIVQFGGQTAINLAEPLHQAGIKLFGTSFDSIDIAEDRDRFEQLLRDLDIPKPPGRAVRTIEAALDVAEEVGYPVLVRPSYVLGGRAMEIVRSREDLISYMHYVVEVSPNAPTLVDKYLVGKEAEVDVIGDGENCLVPGIMEHIERAGEHSGESMAVFPPQSLSQHVMDTMVDYAIRVAKALKIVGLMNIQFVIEGEDVYILEVNPRSSRTVPYLSKITGVPMVQVATRWMLGEKLTDMGYVTGLYAGGLERPAKHVSVKAPVFSFAKLTKVDVNLGPEMKSTGEIMGTDVDYPRALYKAMVASGVDVPLRGAIIATVADPDKQEALPLLRRYHELGYRIFATSGTSRYLQQNGIAAEQANKIHEGGQTLISLIQEGKVNLLINTVSRSKRSEREALLLRRAAVENGVPCLTSLDTAAALLEALESRRDRQDEASQAHCLTIDEYCNLGGS